MTDHLATQFGNTVLVQSQSTSFAPPNAQAESSSSNPTSEYPEASVSATQSTELGDTLALTYDKLDTEAIVASVKDDGAGAIATFIGTTRNTFQGMPRRLVDSLE